MPAQIETILESQERYILELTHNFSDTQDFILSVAGLTDRSRGALKLKVSYIHAEGYLWGIEAWADCTIRCQSASGSDRNAW